MQATKHVYATLALHKCSYGLSTLTVCTICTVSTVSAACSTVSAALVQGFEGNEAPLVHGIRHMHTACTCMSCNWSLTASSRASRAATQCAYALQSPTEADDIGAPGPLEVAIAVQQPQQPCSSPVHSREGSTAVHYADKRLRAGCFRASGPDAPHPCTTNHQQSHTAQPPAQGA